MTCTIRRIWLAALLGGSVTLGCERAATRTPPDPLLASKSPVAGKTQDAGPELLAGGEPSAPMMPVTAVASAPAGMGSTPQADPERGRYHPQVSTSAKSDIGLIPNTSKGANDNGPAAVLATPVSRSGGADPGTSTLATQRQVPGTFGHAKDHSWLQGVLSKDYHGQLALRYRDHTDDDTHGGKVVLESDPRLADFKDGDVLLVEGEIVMENGKPLRCAWNHFPRYRVTKVSLVEHKAETP